MTRPTYQSRPDPLMAFRMLGYVYSAYQETGKMAMSMLEQILTEGEVRGIVKGEAKGKAEGMAIAVASVLESRFGSAPVTVQKKLRNMRDGARIEEMLRLAATCASLKEFQKAL